MRFYNLVIYTGNDEYETKEKIIDEPTFRQIQQALSKGIDLIVSENWVFKRKMIKDILPADGDVAEVIRTRGSIEHYLSPAGKQQMIEEKKKNKELQSSSGLQKIQ